MRHGKVGTAFAPAAAAKKEGGHPTELAGGVRPVGAGRYQYLENVFAGNCPFCKAKPSFYVIYAIYCAIYTKSFTKNCMLHFKIYKKAGTNIIPPPVENIPDTSPAIIPIIIFFNINYPTFIGSLSNL